MYAKDFICWAKTFQNTRKEFDWIRVMDCNCFDKFYAIIKPYTPEGGAWPIRN